MDTINTLLYLIHSIINVEPKKFTKTSSIYDIIEPIFSDNKGTIVSVISQELKNKCKDYELLPDTIINALNDGNRVLLINKFHFYRN